ncbi:MAG: AMP-binding protein [Lautropia sp.]
MQTYGPLELPFPDRRDWTLATILAIQADRYGDKPFLTEPGRGVFTYRQMDRIAACIAGGLLARGFRPGDRMVIDMDNAAEYIQAWFGAARAGIVEVPVNPAYFGDLLMHALTVTQPRCVLVDTDHVGQFLGIASAIRAMELHFFVVGERADEDVRALQSSGLRAEPYETLTASAPIARTPAAPRSDLAAIIFTSGTTGPSKGVMMSHAQCYFGSVQGMQQVRLAADDVYMTANPLFHFNAQFLTTYPTLLAGASMTLYRKFSPSQFSRRLAESGATVTNFVGVMMDWVAKQPPAPTDRLSRLRCIFSAPTPWDLVPEIRRRFGVEAFVECFGHTETCLPIMVPYGVERPRGATGLAVSDWFDIQLADPETDEPVPRGQAGELQIRPREPWIINSGYFGMPEATAAARRNLWFHTGDALVQDEEGWFHFVDRFKDCLRRRGENISSFEVERPILTHPAVLSCAAVGLPADEQGGEEEVAVFVMPRAGMTVTPQEISAWAGERLPAFLNPRYVQVMPQLPMTPSGRPRKAELRRLGSDMAWDRESGTRPQAASAPDTPDVA